MIGLIGVFCQYSAFLDYDLSRIRTGVFTVHKDIADNFAGDDTSHADALSSFQKELVIYMTADKLCQAIITVDQIGTNIITVIVAIHIHFTKDSVGSVSRQTGLYRFIFSKKKNSSQIKAFLPCCEITFIKTCAA